MIPIHIKIGNVETLRTENWSVIPDDRQTQIETIGGVVVQDLGRVSDADKFSCSVTLPSADAITLASYWENRTPVTIRDVSGATLSGMRVIVKRYSYVPRFEDHVAAELEFWRI